MQAAVIQQMEWNVWRVLNNDTATISTLRCLKLYLERLGCNFLDQESVQMVAGSAFALVREMLSDMTFLNCRPSVIAAAIMYAERRNQGVIPFWPSMLAKLTGYQDMSTPELSVAIKSAQRLCSRLQAGAAAVSSGSPGIARTHSGLSHSSSGLAHTGSPLVQSGSGLSRPATCQQWAGACWQWLGTCQQWPHQQWAGQEQQHSEKQQWHPKKQQWAQCAACSSLNSWVWPRTLCTLWRTHYNKDPATLGCNHE